MTLITALLLLTQFISADDQFEHLKQDRNVPSHCEDVSAELFTSDTEIFTFGRADAVSMGFTFEHPLQRHNATILWDYFKGYVKGKPNLNIFRKIKESDELFRDYEIIMANYKDQGVSFGNEGDVLETLAVVDLQEIFPAPMYFITGGIVYRQSLEARTIGELDVVVADAETCAVRYVGEVKLGTGRALRKAYQQLQRFSNFVDKQTGSHLGGLLDADTLEPAPIPVPEPIPAGA